MILQTLRLVFQNVNQILGGSRVSAADRLALSCLVASGTTFGVPATDYLETCYGDSKSAVRAQYRVMRSCSTALPSRVSQALGQNAPPKSDASSPCFLAYSKGWKPIRPM